jgi:hypothetical protein
VVPQLPESETKASVNTVKLGLIAIDVAAERQGSSYTATVTRHGRVDLRIGAVLPDGATVTSATLNGSPVEPELVQTTRGLEAVISAQPDQRTATLVINITN